MLRLVRFNPPMTVRRGRVYPIRVCPWSLHPIGWCRPAAGLLSSSPARLVIILLAAMGLPSLNTRPTNPRWFRDLTRSPSGLGLSGPDIARIVLLHRIGEVPLTEAAVVVAVSSPHRVEAFEAARFGIDTLKATVPIWKREDWSEGTSWGREAQHIIAVDEA